LQLSNLCTLRNRLISTQGSLRTPLKEQYLFVKQGIYKQSLSACKNTLKAIELDIVNINSQIDELINSDDNLKRLITIITSVPAIGTVTAIQIILSTNEFTQMNDAKKFACYAGIAPFKKESGNSMSKGKVSRIANRKMKSLLHICAMVAVSMKGGELRDYYKRKVETEGKPKMLALNAVRYKLVSRIFSCLRGNRVFEKDFNNKLNSVVC